MPYTPPTPRSPALASPALRDGHADSSKTLELPPHAFSPPRSPGSLPRSSVSRAQRSRETLALENTKQNASSPDVASLVNGGSLGSPKQGDSGSSSDDDEHNHAEQVAELHHAVRESMIANGVSHKAINGDMPSAPAQNLDGAGATAKPQSETPKLSQSARKITHSRSSTDSAIVFSADHSNDDSPRRMSADDGSDDEVDPPHAKPPFVRKKSGELVKPAIRPNMRRKHSSMPGTPTFGGKKGVHFDDDIAQVRHFLSLDRPMAVSAGGSPVETFDEEPEYPFNRQDFGPPSTVLDLRLGNFPRQSHERLSQTVRLESIYLAADKKSLVGDVVVANLAFQKSVTARFTLDNWSTTSEVVGQYETDSSRKPKEAGFDLFTFHIRVADQANLEHRTMLICIRYNVNGQEYWDNNAGQNFQVEFSKKEERPSSAPGRQQTVSMAKSSPPRSRSGSHTPPVSHEQTNGQLRTKPSLEDEFGSPIKFRHRSTPQLPDAPPARRAKPTANQFSSRYDFGASLSAALNSAQAQLGERSGIKRSDDPAKRTRTPVGMARKTPEAADTSESPRADTLLSSKQPLDSRAYQEFVSKFCFFGSGNKTSPVDASPQQPATSQSTGSQMGFGSDGAQDDDYIGQKPIARDGHNDERVAPLRLQQPPAPKSRESSSPARGYGSRSASPASITLRYSQEREKGWFSSNTPNPPAIHG